MTADDPENIWTITTRWDPQRERWIVRDKKESIEVEADTRVRALRRLSFVVYWARARRFVA